MNMYISNGKLINTRRKPEGGRLAPDGITEDGLEFEACWREIDGLWTRVPNLFVEFNKTRNKAILGKHEIAINAKSVNLVAVGAPYEGKIFECSGEALSLLKKVKDKGSGKKWLTLDKRDSIVLDGSGIDGLYDAIYNFREPIITKKYDMLSQAAIDSDNLTPEEFEAKSYTEDW